jgi:hypothetical protein
MLNTVYVIGDKVPHMLHSGLYGREREASITRNVCRLCMRGGPTKA